MPADQNHVGPERALTTSVDMSEEVRRALADTTAHGSLLLTRDPPLRTLTHHGGANRDIDEPEPGEWWPVALVEPVNCRVIQFDDTFYPLTTAIASKLGLAQAQPGITPPAAVNWAFRDGPRCELLDPTGTVLASFRHTPDPQWRAAARTCETILVLYGGQLGVRTPYGVAAAEYDKRARDAELNAALAAGDVLAGVVAYARV
jgi:hypothetical protein